MKVTRMSIGMPSPYTIRQTWEVRRTVLQESVGRVVEQPAASQVAKIGNLESMKRGKPLRKALYKQVSPKGRLQAT